VQVDTYRSWCPYQENGLLIAANNGTQPQQPVKPFKLPLPNVPPGNACNKYPGGPLRTVCNVEPNSPTNNCVRGDLLDRYDPTSGYQGGIRDAHCESFAACGMSRWNPAQVAFGCYLY